MNNLSNNTVTLKKGYWFFFEDNGTKFAAQGSIWSGKETIYADDEIVSSKRSFSRSSIHSFELNGHAYSVKFHMSNILTGALECQVTRDGLDFYTQNLAYIPSSPTTNFDLPYIRNTIFGGYSYTLKNGDIDITIHGRGWPCRESIYHGDKALSSQWYIAKKHRHDFSLGARKLSLEWHWLSYASGEIDCRLEEDEKSIFQQRLRTRQSDRLDIKHFLPSILISMVFGFLFGMLLWSNIADSWLNYLGR
ncbi:MAG: hypothetical protein ACI93R_002478 [Flavobacteriales bacterium]|jgi:hypothetical protein